MQPNALAFVREPVTPPDRVVAPRPVLWAAIALALGSWLGLSAPLHGNPVACCLFGALLYAAWPRAAGGASTLGSPADATARESLVRARAWLALIFALALVRANVLPTPGAGLVPAGDAGAAELRVGRFRALGPGQGWLEERGSRGPTELLALEGTELADGEWIALAGEVLRVPWPSGPAAGPLAKQFQGGVAQVQADEVLRIAPGGRREPGAALARLFAPLRASLARRLDATMRPRTAAFARAVLLGDGGGMGSQELDLYTRTGTRHLLTISGLHVAIFAALVPWPLAAFVERRLRRRARATAFLVRVGSLALFALVAGGGAPVQRAALALAFVALAHVLPGRRNARCARRTDGLSLWGLALALEILVDPLAVTSLSVQLSYLATLGILLATRPMVGALRSLSIPFASGWRASGIAAQARGPLALAGRRFARAGVLGVAASAAAVLATLPVTWTRFGEIAPAGIVATPLVVPLLVAAVAAFWLALAAPCAALTHTAELPVAVIESILAQVDRLPCTPLPLPERPEWLVALAVGTALAALSRPSARLSRLAALTCGALLIPWAAGPRALEIVALDVGHGTAVLLRAPGLPALVFDAGSRERRRVTREALLPLLARWEACSVEIVLSHDDRDHASGLARLVERFPPRLWCGALPASLEDRLGADCRRLDAGVGETRWRSGAKLELALVRGLEDAGNEGSRALRVTVGSESVLLCGDAEADGLAPLLGAGVFAGALAGPVRLLLFPHHGSDTPWLGPLLDLSQPAEIWVSGPEPDVAAELDRRGLAWTSTGREGCLELEIAGPAGGLRSAPDAIPRVKRAEPADLD